KVLGGYAPRLSRGQRAAAELAERRLERLDALLERREHVREPLSARVVKVGRELQPRQPLARGGEELANLAGVRHPRRIPEGDLLAAGLAEALGDLEHSLGGHLALIGAAEGDRDHPLAAKPILPGDGDRAPDALERRRDRAVDVLAVVGLGRRQEQVHLVEAVAL